MTMLLLAATLAGTPVPLDAQALEPPAAAEQEIQGGKVNKPAKAASEKNKAKAKAKAKGFNPAELLALFDRIFPAQPDPAPERLTLSRVTAKAIFPDGTYGRMFEEAMGGIVDRVMNLSEADFAESGDTPAAEETLTIREQAVKDDPHFEERMRIMQRVIGVEFAKIAAVIEPKMREGIARSLARRFDEPQLVTVNAFLATDTGRAFGGQMMAMWMDPDVMRAMVTSFPEMIVAVPGAMKRVEAATAHLPKPPKKADEKADEAPAEDPQPAEEPQDSGDGQSGETDEA